LLPTVKHIKEVDWWIYLPRHSVISNVLFPTSIDSLPSEELAW
jgi:hypothetical protein